MRDWSLRAGDPMSLTISADARLCSPDYLNDHIWELSLGPGDPPALAVRTAYGLRARNLRLYYRFTEAGKSLTDPAEFHEAPRLRRFHPNFLSLEFVPVEGLEARAEYWVPESHALAGRLTVVNRTTFPRHLDVEVCGVLNPLEGKALGPARPQQMVRILAGVTGGLQPVLYSTGGPKHGAGPHPALRLGLDFEGGAERSFTWVCAAEASDTASMELARRIAGRNWDAERARVELVNVADTIEIHTGDLDWDAALAMGQKEALRAFFSGGAQLPRPSFVRTRGPDNGFSRTGDASDYSLAWKGQSPLDAYYVSSLLPGAPTLRSGLIENYLSVQTEDGGIDARPGLGGQRSRFLAAPLLAALAWQHYRKTLDTDFLGRVLEPLQRFFNAWFTPERDRDGDGIPEWDHVLQTGFDENPLFDVWYPWSQALAIQTLLNPELESLLFSEGGALTRMAEALGRDSASGDIRERTQRLQAAIAASWDERQKGYVYRDRLTGASWTDRLVGSRKGSGEIVPRRPECEQPVRLLIQVHTKSPAAARPTVEIFGSSQVPPRAGRRKKDGQSPAPAGEHQQSEVVAASQFQWRSGGLVGISALVYGQVERVVIDGLAEKDRAVVRTVNTSGEDITLFTPLWAGAADAGQAQTILRRLTQEEEAFARPFGIPALPASPSSARAGTREQQEADGLAMSVHLEWNQLVGEGLLAYGYREEAAQLVARLMSAVVRGLKEHAAFYERYHAVSGAGMGERGSVAGATPVGLFLSVLGVRVLSPSSVQLEGISPFPWPVTLVYRGLRVLRGRDTTEIKFPNRPAITVTDPAPCVVSA
ncbi:MAG TPA: hypothetical protein VFH29_06005 [Anaerolineales bacterium]|nr:hypothetical protein [Anaerolineales bacterium]